jgi:hypothetical protein
LNSVFVSLGPGNASLWSLVEFDIWLRLNL